MKKLLDLKFKNKKYASLAIVVVWIVCFFISIFFASLKLGTPILIILTSPSELLIAIWTLPMALMDTLPLFNDSILMYIFSYITIIFIHIKVITKRSIFLFVILSLLLLISSYSWISIALSLSVV